MIRVVITLTLDCRDDVPQAVLRWMAENIVHHASQEFEAAYRADYADGYVGPPLVGHVVATVTTVP